MIIQNIKYEKKKLEGKMVSKVYIISFLNELSAGLRRLLEIQELKKLEVVRLKLRKLEIKQKMK